jgi:AraC family transcriptional regulator
MQQDVMSYLCRDSTLASRRRAVERVILQMRERLDAPLSLKEMAGIAFISPYHFNRVFHQITGLPPTKFLYAMRLEAAKRLLVMTDESVTDICFEVGYNSLGTFIRRFGELSGVSPRRFRLMAQSSLESMLKGFEDVASPAPKPAMHRLTGQIDAPADFNGLIFVGLFETPIPEKKPVAGTVISQPGSYSIAPVPDGHFYLLAAGLAWSQDPKEYFLYESTLRGGGQGIRICCGEVTGSTNLSLRPPAPFDPPILLALPLLLAEIMKQERHPGESSHGALMID